MVKNGRSTETDIALATLRYLAQRPTGRATMRAIRRNIPNFIDLTEADRALSSTRRGEEMWEQQVRNITSHHTAEGNYIYEGYLQRFEGGLCITEKGMKRIGAR